jgi:hypothetical protein
MTFFCWRICCRIVCRGRWADLFHPTERGATRYVTAKHSVREGENTPMAGSKLEQKMA